MGVAGRAVFRSVTSGRYLRVLEAYAEEGALRLKAAASAADASAISLAVLPEILPSKGAPQKRRPRAPSCASCRLWDDVEVPVPRTAAAGGVALVGKGRSGTGSDPPEKSPFDFPAGRPRDRSHGLFAAALTMLRA